MSDVGRNSQYWNFGVRGLEARGFYHLVMGRDLNDHHMMSLSRKKYEVELEYQLLKSCLLKGVSVNLISQHRCYLSRGATGLAKGWHFCHRLAMNMPL